MSGHCKCGNIDAPCPPPSLSYSSFHAHALSQGVKDADILKIAGQCNLKAIEIITQGHETKDDTLLPLWAIVFLIPVVVAVIYCICWCRKTKRIPDKEADEHSIRFKIPVLCTKELNAAKTDSRIKGINL